MAATRKELPELTGLRGIAIVIVLAGHLMQRVDRFHDTDGSDWLTQLLPHLTAPAAGVFLFFTISGLLIAERLAPQRSLGARWMTSFYWRRFTRIAIPYYFVLLATFVAMGALSLKLHKVKLFAVVPASLFDSLVSSLGFAHYAVWGTFPRLFPPGWSNEVEVQFYLAAPLLCLGYARCRNQRQRQWLGVLALVASLLLSWITVEHGPQNLKYSLPVYLPYFWLGILLRDRLHERGLPRVRAGWGWLTLLVYVSMQPYLGGHLSEQVLRSLMLVVIFACVFSSGSTLAALSRSRVMQTLGRYSFSIYLVHLQIIHVVADLVFARVQPQTFALGLLSVLLVAAPVLTAVAYVFHQLVELPTMRIARRAEPEPAPSELEVA